ncbi:MAG: nucleoside monophosphate kinase [Chloroflexi bacterium]|nr:nucleoside monophosphate kinase [Chloroflexota bacterium]HEV8054634.1 nucleoside monophosphate kinase [Candidatus Limnocylindrales bacterium]
MKVYVMVGAPGAGKGTQAEILSERVGLPHIASGELFREAMRDGTRLGEQVKSYISRGALVPDELAIKVIAARLARPDAAEGAILDGFPRTRPQAEVLDAALARRGAHVAAALFIGIAEDALLRRLSGRWICQEAGHAYHEIDRPPRVAGVCDEDGSPLYQRPDDRPDTVRARLAQQLPPMYEVIDYYNEQGVLTPVDGEGPVEGVADALVRAIDSTRLAPRGGRELRQPAR